jgi:hypothetical protein
VPNPHELVASLGRAFDEASRHDARTPSSLKTLLKDAIAPRVRRDGFAVECDELGTMTIALNEHKVWLTLEVEKGS